MKSRLATSIDSMLFSRMATAFTMHAVAPWSDEVRQPVNAAPRVQRETNETNRTTGESPSDSARSN